MNTRNETNDAALFEDLRHIFRGHSNTTTPIDAFLWPLVKHDRHHKAREKPLIVNWGNIGALKVTLEPSKSARSLRAPELVNAIAAIYNDDYWLFALWSHFSNAARGSAISRAIVRAFIKHCVFLTVEEIARYSVKIDADQAVRHARTPTVYYYKRVFDWSAIWKCIQLPARRKIQKRLRRAGKDAHALDFAAARMAVPELKAIFEQYNLPKVVADATDQKEDYIGIIKTTSLMFSMIVDRGKIRHAIRGLVKGR
jgi:hypothetical protein